MQRCYGGRRFLRDVFILCRKLILRAGGYSTLRLVLAASFFGLIATACLQVIQPLSSLPFPASNAPGADDGTIYAASTSRDAVQAAVMSAAAGETVVVPPGHSDWDTPVVMSTGITLRGSGPGKTVIRNMRTDYLEGLLTMNVQIGQFYRVTGFTFESVRGGYSDNSDAIMIIGTTNSFRIDHNYFTHGGSHSVWISGAAYGLIDHNQFVNASQEVISIFDEGTGDQSWNRPLDLGGRYKVYIENNYFRLVTKGPGGHVVTGINGARYVFRYNTVTSNEILNATLIDAHGNYFVDRGTRSVEIYGNTLEAESSYEGIYIRGGTALIFDNSFTGSFYNPIVFTNYRSWQNPDNSTTSACPVSVTDGGTTVTYYPDVCTYPAPDQIQDTYVWNNTYNGRPAVPWVTDRGLDRTDIQSGRDYFLQPRPGYTPFPFPYPISILNSEPRN